MNFEALLEQLDINKNKNYFLNDKNKKNMSGILYFNDDTYEQQANFLDNIEKESLYTVKTSFNVVKEENIDNFKNLSFKIKTHIDLNKYNLNGKFYNITECLMNVLDFYNYNSRNLFFKKLLREFDIYKLYKKYNYRKLVKKSLLRKMLQEKNDEDEIIIQLMSDYLNINLILFSNNEMKVYSKDRIYEIYRPTIFIYKYNKIYYFLSDKQEKKIFTSDDKINLRIKKYFICESIKNIKKEETQKNIKDKIVKKDISRPKLVDFKKLKVVELRNLCIQYNIPIKEKGKNGKMKNVVKKILIEKLKMVLK